MLFHSQSLGRICANADYLVLFDSIVLLSVDVPEFIHYFLSVRHLGFFHLHC